MFSNKIRSFPAGTFVATPIRVIAIIQLCISFTLLSYYIGYPFMGELFEIKSEKLLYETVIGKESSEAKILYSKLPESKKTEIESEYQLLKAKSERPFLTKLKDSLNILLFTIPPFEKAWIAFSVAISILILLKIEGARPAAWILPLIVLAYGVDSVSRASREPPSSEAALFPAERYIIEKYIPNSLSPNILEQNQQLLHGFRLYLIEEWAQSEPSKNPAEFSKQAERGEFFFNLARIQARQSDKALKKASAGQGKPFLPLIVLYFLWNLFFAWFLNRKTV